MAMSRRPRESRAARNMPTLLKSMATLPFRSSAITPPSPPVRRSFSWMTSRTAARRTRRVQPLALGAPRLLELPLAPLGAEISARHERHAVLERELFRALGHEQYVRALLHHEARELHRVPDVADRRDRPGARPVPVHDGGVELGIPLVVQH